ncbi:ScbA/BarX family gamma-butyrolactone biosynthesis protein [Streptomyces sp. NPDC000351]|uniref:ScbA/BarX family gamma-butyrolactone biosynthesis protein n=1 Tax=Streptomyces sp. NPDC000351 TaxID=3154250 RepID=UPI00331A00CB
MSANTFRIERPTSVAQPHGDHSTEPLCIVVPRFPASFTTTVPKEFVHRASVAEVMLTDWERVDDTHFTLSAQLPRMHGFFTALDGCHDPLLLAETIRQAGILLAHAEFGVPLDQQFVMWDLAIDLEPGHLLVQSAPASLDITVTCTEIKRRGTNLAGMHYTTVIRRDGAVAATGGATFTCTSPAVYRRVRAARVGDDAPAPIPLTSPTAPQTVGRLSPTDVVLSPASQPDHWQLRVDTHHPVLFDHPVDHVPGMVLLEAARQAAVAFLGRSCLPTGITSEFARYVELDAPCMIEVCRLPSEAHGEERLLVTARQDGAVVFTSAVTVASDGS